MSAYRWWACVTRLLDALDAHYVRVVSGRAVLAGQRGQNLVEYSLIILLAVLAVIGGLALIGPTLANIFSNVKPAL